MSSVLAPASLSLSTPMICSSVKRFRFMGLPPSAIQRWKIPVRNGPDIGGKVRTFPLVTPSARIGLIPPYDADPNAALQLVRPDIRRDGEGRPHLPPGLRTERTPHCTRAGLVERDRCPLCAAHVEPEDVASRVVPLTSNLRWDRCCGIHIDLRHPQALFLLIGPACKVPSGL